MALLEERLEEVEERADRLETIFGQFMIQTGNAVAMGEEAMQVLKRRAGGDGVMSACPRRCRGIHL